MQFYNEHYPSMNAAPSIYFFITNIQNYDPIQDILLNSIKKFDAIFSRIKILRYPISKEIYYI